MTADRRDFRIVTRGVSTAAIVALASALFVTAGLRAEPPFEAPTASEAFPVYSDANRISEPAKMPAGLEPLPVGRKPESMVPAATAPIRRPS